MVFTQPIPMPITPDVFREIVPAFAADPPYTDEMIEFWALAASVLLTCRWGNSIGIGTVLFMGHNLALQAQNLQAAQSGGIPGTTRGLVASESAGSVSVSYDTGTAAEEDAGHWNLTIYGQQFIRLARMFGAGPIQLNVPPWGSGACMCGGNWAAAGMQGSLGPGWYDRVPEENVPVGKYLPRTGSGGIVSMLLVGLLWPLLGCIHPLIVVNAGVANKTAASLGTPLTPEAYCLALTTANVHFGGKPAPELSQAQSDFCRGVLAAKVGR